jgi:hypothetical protein
MDRRVFTGTLAGSLLPAPLAAFDAFLQEHRRSGELDGGVDGWCAWMACDCGASMSRLLLGAAAAVIIILTGCSKTLWIIPPGGSEQQLSRDSYECRRDAATLTPAPRSASPPSTGFVHPSPGYTMAPQGRQDLGTAPGDQAQEEGLVARCMESKGYRRQ